MVQLTIYKESNNRLWDKNHKEAISCEVETIEKAIQIGQKSGAYYEVFDTKTCRLIDWNEVNVKVEDDWYYDETELMWKRRSQEESITEYENYFFDQLFNFYKDNNSFQLSY